MYWLCVRKYNIIKDQQLLLRILQMHRVNRNYTDTYHQPHPGHQQLHKSPLRRQNINQHHPARSPIRSRTPTRHVSPLKSTGPFPSSIKYISHVSPSRQPSTNYENKSELSNGKNLRFINSNYNDKIYQTVKNDKPQDYNKRSERKNSESNRLFGKLVDKIQSGKKPGMKGQENYHKTSAFIENSDTKYNRMEQTTGRNEGGVFRQLFTQVKNNEPRSNKKLSMRQTTNEPAEQGEELNCLVYKIKNPSTHEDRDLSPQAPENNYISESAAANIPTIFMKRKYSKNESVPEQLRVSQKTPPPQKKVDESEDMVQFKMFLKIIEGGSNDTYRAKCRDEVVKMSMKVDDSLSMDPFL